ncbi:MAG: hypothetical protein JXR31_12755 [Prolixibacteraceae bacterium]|nr:hypothetical protein [Prolixibacteraceae bacterium]MBN2775118.1 hypothetical protein [Prolixibacteraceae bacterium]
MKKLACLVIMILITVQPKAQIQEKDLISNIEKGNFQEPDSKTLYNLNVFESDELLNITLRFDITSFIKNKNKDKYQDAILQIHYSSEKTVTKVIELKPRGNFRKDKCFFPPVRIKFESDTPDETGLAGKIKLVTHCSTNKKYEAFLLKEYLIYKMYSLFTDYSFKVRLLDISYIDTGKKKTNYRQFGFIVEPLEILTERTETTEVDPSTIYKDKVDSDFADLVALFEYMIGHTDWRIEGGHNLKYIKTTKVYSPYAIPVPYDFDFSGFVGAPYSYPQVWTSLDNVWDREYLGYCRSNDKIYLKTIQRFIDKKEEILDLIKSFDYLSAKEKEKALSYLDEFFAQINNPEEFIYTLKNECRDDF